MLFSVKCNYNAMFYWALQYGAYVEVIFPTELLRELARTIQNMHNRYSREG